MNISFKKKSGTKTDRPQPSARFEGFFDDINTHQIHGWVVDRVSAQPADVVVVCGQAVLGIVRADLPREDVAAAHDGMLHCGFVFPVAPDFAGPYEAISVVAVDKAVGEAVMRACKARDRDIDAPPIPVDGIRGLDDQRSVQTLPKTPHAIASLKRLGATKSDRFLTRTADTPTVRLIEIQDLLNYLRIHNNVTGIQRTVCGLINSLLDEKNNFKDFSFCAVSDSLGYVSIFNSKAVHQLVMTVVAGNAPQSDLWNKIEILFLEAKIYKPGPKDSFVISGAYWILYDFGTKLYHLRRNGVVIGTYIYDIIPITSPQWVMTSTNREVMQSAFDVFALSDYFLTISEFVKVDLDRLLQVEFGRGKPMAAVPLPHELPFSHVHAKRHPPVAAKKSAKQTGYVLCVCTIEGRKNHILLARVWAALIRRHGFAEVPRLVLVGKWGWRFEDFRDVCESTNYLDNKIILRFGIDDGTLRELYENCLFTVFPSFVEGWGLPVGESLTLGKFCIASNASSIPEVGGAFVDYFNPHDLFEALNVIENAIYTDGYLEGRTRNVVENFKPRTWDELAKTFMTEMERHVLQAQAGGRDVDAIQPELRPAQVYDFEGLISSQTVAWTDKLVRFCLVSGWQSMEHWGAWSSASQAEVSFRTQVTPGEELTVLIRLNLPNANQGEPLVIRTGDQTIADLSGSGLNESPKWIAFTLIADPKGLATFALCRPVAYARDEKNRKLFIGISGLAYHLRADQAAALRTAKGMAKTVDAAVPSA